MRKRFNWKKIAILFSLTFVLFLLVFVFVSYRVWSEWTGEVVSAKYTDEQISEAFENSNVLTEDTTVREEVTYELLNGWNFISFPVKPLSFNNASGLILDVVDSGGYVTTVSFWNGDSWTEYTQRGLEKFGHDFPIIPGKAYFVRNNKKTLWRVVGRPLRQIDLGRYELEEGWNAIGIIGDNFTAADVVDDINDGKEKSSEIDWWRSGSWEVFVKRIYSKENIEEYGVDFEIQENHGYMIKMNESVDWSPKL